MTDTITPASLRAHADYMERVHLDGISAAELLQEADRLEAEAAREVEVLQLAKRLVQEEFGGYNQWHDLPSGEQERRVQYVKFILAFLAADGRLLPEGAHCPNCLVALVGVEEEDTPPAVSVPDSGPDGTPEKPWPTWQDVPEGVKYRSAGMRREFYFENRGGERFLVDASIDHRGLSRESDLLRAPFVRVDGDKA